MREIRQSGSVGGGGREASPYPKRFRRREAAVFFLGHAPHSNRKARTTEPRSRITISSHSARTSSIWCVT
jgi:hypothetical protein